MIERTGVLERRHAPLAPLTTLGLGGSADRLLTAYDEASLVELVRAADADRHPVLVLGGGSNVVLPDEGLDTVMRVAVRGVSVCQESDRVLLTAAAGEDWDGLVALCVTDGLVGLEALSGIPGQVGASPVQNIGAYGQEVSHTITSVRALDRTAGHVVELGNEQCGFAYRDSVLKQQPGRWLVLAVTFALRLETSAAPVRYAELARTLGVELGQRAPLAEVRAAVLDLRRGKGMVLDAADPDTRSAGSFFTNPLLDDAQLARLHRRVSERLGPDAAAPQWPDPSGRTKVPAAWLIERAGFTKGAFDGAAGISTKHTLALVNRGGASTADLLLVARAVRDGVREAFDVELHAEPVLVGTRL